MTKLITRCVTLFFFLMMFECRATAAKLESLVIHETGGKTSISCELSGPFTHKAFTLSNPSRVVLDFQQTTSTLNLKQILHANGFITDVRAGHPDAHTYRLVFDARTGVTLRTLPWQPANKTLRGLRFELVPNGVVQKKMASVIVSPKTTQPRPSGRGVPLANARGSDSSVKTWSIPSRSLRDVVVVIDPGHGGTDPGAMGMNHSAEKHVVLAIALKLKRLIDQQPGMRAVLTRNGDYYVGLRERLNIARHHKADIFVAIHADAFNNRNSNGASVFALSQRGATSEAAQWLAEKENHSELGGVKLSGLDDRNGAIRTVLLDLSQTATIGASLQMGTRVLRGLDTMTTLHNNKVEQARFVVLKSPDIPSILVETGFISNPREERNLNSPAYQMRLTQAIFQGIKGYFWEYPPHGTRLEALSQTPMTFAQARRISVPW